MKWKISDDARVSKFCVTNLTIKIDGWKEREKRKTVLLIIMKKYPTMLESLNFVSQKIINVKSKRKNILFFVLLIKYSAMSESLNFVSKRLKIEKKCFYTSKNSNFKNKIFFSKTSFQNIWKISVFQK